MVWCVGMWACESQGTTLSVILRNTTDLLCNRASQWPAWLPIKPQGPFCLCTPSPGAPGCATIPVICTWVLGIGPRACKTSTSHTEPPIPSACTFKTEVSVSVAEALLIIVVPSSPAWLLSRCTEGVQQPQRRLRSNRPKTLVTRPCAEKAYQEKADCRLFLTLYHFYFSSSVNTLFIYLFLRQGIM